MYASCSILVWCVKGIQRSLKAILCISRYEILRKNAAELQVGADSCGFPASPHYANNMTACQNAMIQEMGKKMANLKICQSNILWQVCAAVALLARVCGITQLGDIHQYSLPSIQLALVPFHSQPQHPHKE